jgi:cobalt-zinc-cadmium efflux system outer membrane protein
MRFAVATAAVLLASLGSGARAAETPISFSQAIDRASHVSPDIAVARAHEAVARAEVGIAGILPNPTLSVGTSTQTARLSVTASVPLLILGQRGAAVEASRADLATTQIDTEVATVDVRAGVAHAYVALWRAQGSAAEQAHTAAVVRHLEDAVAGRVDLGAAANVDGLRAHAERLRADANAQQAMQLVAAAGSDLGRWLGVEDGAELRAADAPPIPAQAPSLAALRERIGVTPALRRERADFNAAQARVARERALVRPQIVVDVGADAFDQTLCPNNGACDNPPVNYRGTIGVEVPLLNQRGPYIEREQANAAAAATREAAQRVRVTSALISAYRTFEAWDANARALAEGVVPAANAAAEAAEESYTLGRAPLVAVLDAERARIDANLSLLDARAQEADAWIEVEHAAGAP